MIMFLETYQDLTDKEMSDFEIIENLNLTENELRKYAVSSVCQVFKNMNMIKRNLMALHASQNLDTKKLTKRRKCRRLLKRKQNVRKYV